MQEIITFMQHHLALCAAVFIVLALLIILEFIKLKRNAKSLTPTQATQQINHQNAVVIDLRSTDAFANGHIVGSQSIPFSQLEQQSKKLEKWLSQPLILVCANGIESQRAATNLIKKGFNAHILQGGLRAWQQSGMPLVKK